MSNQLSAQLTGFRLLYLSQIDSTGYATGNKKVPSMAATGFDRSEKSAAAAQICLTTLWERVTDFYVCWRSGCPTNQLSALLLFPL
jgi:hypothetical protein